MKERRKKRPFIQFFGVSVIVLALVRCVFPGVASIDRREVVAEVEALTPSIPAGDAPHPIYSVPSYDRCFPDSNHVQLLAAERWGVSPVRDREEAEERKSELVYVACSPYYQVDNLHSSIPYLVPRAAILLQDIGQAFYDSLYVKGLPLHQFLVTSLLRTKADVSKLRRSNGNATENSCHLYGTTFDISYVSFRSVSVPGEPRRRQVRDDSLKFVLSEVLNDMRQNGRCYIKYEKRQSCFHMTVR